MRYTLMFEGNLRSKFLKPYQRIVISLHVIFTLKTTYSVQAHVTQSLHHFMLPNFCKSHESYHIQYSVFLEVGRIVLRGTTPTF